LKNYQYYGQGGRETFLDFKPPLPGRNMRFKNVQSTTNVTNRATWTRLGVYSFFFTRVRVFIRKRSVNCLQRSVFTVVNVANRSVANNKYINNRMLWLVHVRQHKSALYTRRLWWVCVLCIISAHAIVYKYISSAHTTTKRPRASVFNYRFFFFFFSQLERNDLRLFFSNASRSRPWHTQCTYAHNYYYMIIPRATFVCDSRQINLTRFAIPSTTPDYYTCWFCVW